MNDVDRHAEVSLDSDRLEQLLEVPAPAQPVVMIEYRNRGVPWWLLVTLVVLVPVVALIAYQQLVVQTFQAQAANARYLTEKLKAERAVDEQPKAEPPPVEPVAASAAPIVISAQAAPAPAAAQPPAAPAATPEVKPQPARLDGVDEPALAGAGQPPEARVRSNFPIQLDPAVAAAAPKSPVASANGAAGGASGPAPRDDSVKTQVALPQQARAGAADGPGDGGPAANRDRAALESGVGPSSVAPAGQPAPDPRTDQLPSPEEMRTQLAEEAARKNAEEAEAANLLNDRLRVRRYEDRIQFHQELREILARDVKTAGTEIDALSKRHRGDSDPKARAKARSIWRNGRLLLATRVSQMRSMDISESDILDLMSDNLYARMHAPGGPRDGSEVRVRAARLLLSCELSGGNSAPDAGSASGSAPKRRRTTGTDSPR